MRIWHSTTYRAETTLNYGMDRAWSLACTANANKLAVGYDDGTVVLKLGHEQPVASMDQSTGKLVYAVNSEIMTVTLKGIGAQAEADGIADGERLPTVAKDLGSTEVFPQTVKHNTNGRFIVVCGDASTSSHLPGAAQQGLWAGPRLLLSQQATGDYAIRESIAA